MLLSSMENVVTLFRYVYTFWTKLFWHIYIDNVTITAHIVPDKKIQTSWDVGEASAYQIKGGHIYLQGIWDFFFRVNSHN